MRFHYGCAHPVLKDIEDAYVTAAGPDWLRDEHEARTSIVLGDPGSGLDWLDYRELWQVLAALAVAGGTIFGAFCLSFFTPTVGLGCRSGAYLIFVLVALTLLLFEMFTWWVVDARKERLRQLAGRWARRNAATPRHDEAARRKAISRERRREEFANVVFYVPRAFARGLSVISPPRLVETFEQMADVWRHKSTPTKLEYAILRPMEGINATWLVSMLSSSFTACTLTTD